MATWHPVSVWEVGRGQSSEVDIPGNHCPCLPAARMWTHSLSPAGQTYLCWTSSRELVTPRSRDHRWFSLTGSLGTGGLWDTLPRSPLRKRDSLLQGLTNSLWSCCGRGNVPRPMSCPGFVRQLHPMTDLTRVCSPAGRGAALKGQPSLRLPMVLAEAFVGTVSQLRFPSAAS